MRLFIGIPLPAMPGLDAVLDELVQVGRGIRPVPAAKRHLTLRFLGHADPAEVVAGLHPALAALAPLQGSIQGLGGFPDARRARVAWAGVDAPGLLNVAELVRAATANLGQPETHPFTPHATLARLDPARDLTAWCSNHADEAWGAFAADAVMLYASVPGMAAYSPLATVRLGP